MSSIKKTKKNNLVSSFSSSSFPKLLKQTLKDSQHDRFFLHIQAKQLQELNNLLNWVTEQSEFEQQQWMSENGSFITDMLETFTNNAAVILDGLQMDEETMSLSMQVIHDLNEVASKVKTLTKN